MKQEWSAEDFRRVFQQRTPGVQGAKGIYAILVPLVELDGQLQLLFERRSETLRGQPGETCFPGGKVEPGETPAQAALRETCEEIGVQPEDIRLIAELDLIQDISSRVIYPFLAELAPGALDRMVLNRDEVQEVFLVPLPYLRRVPPYIYTAPMVVNIEDDFPYEKIGYPNGDYVWRSGEVDVPVYEYEGHQIWGLTARTVRWLLEQMEQEGL